MGFREGTFEFLGVGSKPTHARTDSQLIFSDHCAMLPVWKKLWKLAQIITENISTTY
jgi:hypothetical protein